MLTLLFYLLAGLAFLTLAGFALLSRREQEPRAARRAFALGLGAAALLLAATWLPLAGQAAMLLLIALLAVGLLAAFCLPGPHVLRPDERPSQRIDERDILFARARLAPGSPNYAAYYRMRPEKQPIDDATRSLPGLLSSQAPFANRTLFSATQASFGLIGALREAVDGPAAADPAALPPPAASVFLKDLARYYGALEVGIAHLEPAHYYSHIGRGAGVYGDPIEAEHAYAIVFTVEMRPEMINTGPFAPGVMESAHQYVESARVAVQLAGAIRLLGHAARAHIDGNYRVVAPLVARDAGLGEIGRMGLLITPHHGPRVRLGVVTTNLPLVADGRRSVGRRSTAAVLDFCAICKKCADCCPSKSIPSGERQEIEGVLRWQINAESCFRYWCSIGTDCGRCLAVCPYSHPDHPAHNLVRWGIQRSAVFRRLATAMDDFFYGRRPPPHPAPAWTTTLDRPEQQPAGQPPVKPK